MSKEKRRVPKLRFPGFTEDWEQRKADYIFKSVTDKGYPELPVLSASQELGMVYRDQNGIDIQHDKKNETSYKRVLPGQFVIHLRSFQGGFAYSEIEGITSPAYTVMSFKNSSEQYGLFWKHVFKSKTFIKRLETITYGIRDGRSISFSDFKSLLLQYPSFSEQKLIGDSIAVIERGITLHQRKLDNLKLKKKALLQKLFPKNGERYPELRFPGFTDAWEQRKLESLFTKYEDKVNTPSSGYWRLGLRSHCKGTFHTYIDAGNELETAEMNRVKSGNFILNITFAWERALAVTNDEDQDKLVSHRFPQFKPNNDLVIDFFKHTLMDKRFKHHLELSSPGGAGRNKVLKVADMLKYELLVPSIKEQNEISSFLNHVDYIITLHQRKLDHLQLQKKALLQQMFV